MVETKPKPFRAYLAYLLMRAALWCHHEWVQDAAMSLVKRRVAYHMHMMREQGWDYEEEPEPEHITVTFH